MVKGDTTRVGYGRGSEGIEMTTRPTVKQLVGDGLKCLQLRQALEDWYVIKRMDGLWLGVKCPDAKLTDERVAEA